MGKSHLGAGAGDLRYTIEELDKPYDRGRRLLVQTCDVGAAQAAFDSLVKSRPKARLLWREWTRIMGETNPAPPTFGRENPEDYLEATERKESMCGRYAVTLPPEAMRQLFGVKSERINFGPRWNAAPTQQLPVIRYNPEVGIRSLDLLRWGLVHRKAKDMSGGAKAINARSELASKKWPFDDAFAKRRALVPATAFYEWKAEAGGKQPYAIGLANDSTMAFAGLWEGWQDPVSKEYIRTFSIITTTPNALMAEIHERMPVILPPAAWPIWLGEMPAEVDQLNALLVPYAAEAMRAWPVGKEVGSVKNDRQELLAPLIPSKAAG